MIARLVAVAVRHLAPVAGVREEEEVSARELLRRVPDRVDDRLRLRLTREEDLGLELLRLRDRLHVARVLLARLETAVPTVVVGRVDAVQPDVKRDRLG